MRSLALLLLPSLGFSALTDRPRCKTCSSKTNACGLIYGGCYNSCSSTFDEAFPTPLCPPRAMSQAQSPKVGSQTTETTSDILLPAYAKDTYLQITPTPSAFATTLLITSTSTCTPQSICVDKINSCYIRFGGCYDANYCDGNTTSIQTPACPTLTTLAATTA